MKFIKNHLKEFILIVIAGGILIFCGVAFAIMWFAGGNNVYGDRLDGIEKVKLSDTYIKDVEKKLKEKEFVTDVTYNLNGRLLSFIITVADDTNVDEAKKLGDIVIQGFNEEELAFYDLQLSLKDSGEKEESRYPFIATKHKTSEIFVWSNN